MIVAAGYDGLYTLYLIVGIAVGLVTIGLGFWQIRKRVDKAVKPIKDATPQLVEVAAQLDETLKRGHNLTHDVEQYEAVAAANSALRQVIADSTRQLAEAATQVAMSTEELRKVRVELAQTVADKHALQMRVTALESEVRELRTKLEYFTKPQFGGDETPQT